MNVICDKANAETFAAAITSHGGEVGMEIWVDFVRDGPGAIFGTKNHMDQQKCQRLRNAGRL